MFDDIFVFLNQLDGYFWGYAAFMMIAILGCCLTYQARFFQLRALPSIIRTFHSLMKNTPSNSRGLHPLKVFFASVGGMIGIGNVVGIVTAVQIGGPGALFWVWMAAIVGTIIKYSEIFLGLKNRVKNDQGGYDGGPMYFLQHAFKSKFIAFAASALLCIYGVEIYIFSVITDSLSTNLEFNRQAVIVFLLAIIFYASVGGINRVGKICAWTIPGFIVLYISMCLWIIFNEISSLPSILHSVFVSAFTGHAAIGGFAGSTALLAIQHGIARAAYSADIGIGFDSIIQSESNEINPERQARLAMLGVCVDNIVCTMSILVVLMTGVWNSPEYIPGSLLVQTALNQYFPYMELFMPIFLFILGYTTMIAYFSVGLKCAKFISPTYGRRVYLVYGLMSLTAFSFIDQTQALLIMSLAGALLLMTNLFGIFRLRHQLTFSFDDSQHYPAHATNCAKHQTNLS